jgi:DNA-binding response OmpR family regulator
VIRVLHIDDEAPIRLLSRVNLEAEGMEVIEAAEGETGLRLAKREQPDLILLGVMMPGLLGWQVAEELLKDWETREIPIVFLTARAEFRDRARGFDLGAVDYVTKPFNPVELASRIRAVLARLERGERDALRCENILDLLPLTVLARAVQAQVAKTPEIPPGALAPRKQQADAIAEVQRLVAQQLETQEPLLWGFDERDLLRHVSTLRPPAPAIDLEQERAVDQAAEDMRADESEGEFGGLDDWTRAFLRDLPEDERRQIRRKLAALILAIANHVFDPTEKAKARSLVRLVTVLRVLMALYGSVTRAIDAVEGEGEDTQT